MALIDVKELSFGYDNVEIIKKLSFKVDEGDYLCVIGENGVGKSTLIKVLLGLKKPYSGTIEFGDGLKPHETGYLAQQTLVQKDFPATVREIVLSGCQGSLGKGFFYKAEHKKLAEENMKRMNIYELADKSYRELSGGQQQRVLFARCLCATKKLIVLDEPSASLDRETTKEMYSIIRKLNHEGTAILMISHDIETALAESKHVLMLNDHENFYGTVSEYKEWKGGNV